MSNYPQNMNEKSLQSLAVVPHLCHVKKRATNALATHQWPSTQPTKGLSIMPLIPITAISVFLQGGAL